MTVRMWLTGALCAGFLATACSVAAAQALRIVPIDPVPGGHVSAQRPAIEFEIHTADDASVTRNEVHVTLDGVDASRDLQIAGSRLEIVPHDRLSLGAHQVDVSVQDTSGERAVDHWTFTIDSGDAAVPTVRDDTSASNVGSDYSDGYSGYDYGGYGGGVSGYPGAYGSPYGYYPGAGAFFPVGYGPYYIGEPLNFIYTGFQLGGFVTIGGFPGQYPLVPFAPYYYFVTVPVPANYNGGLPVAVCHHCDHRRRLLSVRPVDIEHAHRPAGNPRPPWVAPRWRPTLASLASLPGTPSTVRRILARRPAGGPQTIVGPHGVTIVRSGSPVRSAAPGAEPRVLPIARDSVPLSPRRGPVVHSGVWGTASGTPHAVRSVPGMARMPVVRSMPAVPRFSPVTRQFAPLAPHFSPVAPGMSPHVTPVAPHFAAAAPVHVAPSQAWSAPRAAPPVAHAVAAPHHI